MSTPLRRDQGDAPLIETISKNLSQEQIASLQRESEGKALIDALKKCKRGRMNEPKGERMGEEFKSLCAEIIEWVFREEFRHVSVATEARTYFMPGYGVAIKDITLYNMPRNTDPGCFWEKLRTSGCRTIVFECKNYALSHKITEHDIYQLFGYLTESTGRFGVILCRSKNVHYSAAGALKKLSSLGYMIFLLSDEDMVELLQRAIERKPIEYFFAEKDHQWSVSMPVG